MAQEYIYAVARIKARELTLLTRSDIDRLMACKTPEECLRFLADKGWGNGSGAPADEVLALETEKTWALMHELVPDLTPFHILLYPIDFNNMKAAIKCAATGAAPHEVFMSGGTVEPEVIENAVKQNDFSLLPELLAEPAAHAMQTLLQTRDGQRCDLILDRACLEAIRAAGHASDNALIQSFARLTVDTADIKIAVRAMKTGKSRAFLEESLAESDTLNLDTLMTEALKTPEDFYN
ncbi:MAG: V-type ATPase subunit, partial [Clostridia bacterium]|nr:V-type ATPase subunit [Clostridia bacterium]